MKWTKEQQNVIDFRNRDILVSAAAGSGKTAVLVERIIKRITDKEHPVDIDRLLVVTFTKAAASEMRERIGQAIERECEKDPQNQHLRRQSALIHHAMITTIDSFCLFVVRNHFEEIDLDPDFRIADEGEIRLLEQDVLKQVFEEKYEAEEETFETLIRLYSGKRNDQAVREMVSRIYKMSLSSPWPEEWIEKIVKPYQVKSTEELLHTPMLEDIVKNTGMLLADMAEQIRSYRKLALEADGPAAYDKTLESDEKIFTDAQKLTDYRSLCAFFSNMKLKALSPIRNFTGDGKKKEKIQSGRNEIKKELDTLRKKYFDTEPEKLLEQLQRLRPVAEELSELTLVYTRAMQRAKKKKKILDFSDIEHFALKILVDEKTKESRLAAEEFRIHFEEIMIDEYQDSNQVQEEIMNAVSRHADGCYNMFMVGDVKQSIYRFRLARPELFMQKYASFTTDESQQQKIDLHQNFRSRFQVLEFCNDIFYKIMSPDLGNVAYDADAALYPGAEYPQDDRMQAELLLVDEADELLDADLKQAGKREIEAHLVASRINRLMKETRVTDKVTGKLRSLKYSDIVILFRGLKDWGSDFVRVLGENGIPAYVESQTGYFSAVEVQTVLNMLRILDNPYQDIPMAAVLKSEIAGLDDEELAQIRVEEPDKSFAEAALLAMKKEEEGTLAEFYKIYQELRSSRDLPIHELIQKFLALTGYGNYVAALPAGDRRAANIAMLVEKAVDYEKTSYRGLFHFVRYIDLLQKYEIDFGEADTTSENADVVRIMTIHKSKGLEFPVVFVSGLSRKFNQMDTKDKLVVHPDLGMGICEITEKPKQKKNCIFRSEIADRLQRENLGEELRVLYVALTRAKEKLILTGLIKEEEKTISSYTGNVIPKKPVSYRQRVGAGCYLDWILPAMLSYPDKYTISVIPPQELVFETVQKEADTKENSAGLMEKIGQADDILVQQYDRLFSYEYPYRSDFGKKSKYSVSELKHESMVLAYDRNESEAQVPEFLLEEKEIYVPDFAAEPENEEERDKNLNRGAKRGTAMHRVMECMDFHALTEIDTKSEKAVHEFVAGELERMLADGDLTGEWYELVLPEMIEDFVRSDVALRMAEAEQKGLLFREKPFVMQHEDVLVQGIIDVFWLEGDSIILLDYKTDRVKESEELRQRYTTQLVLYAEALERVFSNENVHRKADEKLIYSFRLREVVRL